MTAERTKAHRPTIRPHTVIRSLLRPQELQYEHYTLEDPAKKLPLDSELENEVGAKGIDEITVA